MADVQHLTLAIDIGGTGLKASVVDETGQMLTDRVRLPTPVGAPPQQIVETLAGMVAPLGAFDRVSVGFPGVVLDDVVQTAPNLDPSWHGHDLGAALKRLTKKPVHVCNDADVQGLGDVSGKGVELVLTLGTGLGSALFVDGRLVPNLELGHHPFRDGKTYEDLLGKAALDKHGKKKWRKRVGQAIAQLQPIFNFRTLYLGGGNAEHLRAKDLPKNVHLRSNEAGLLGGIMLWR